jgi:hypothetical protein
MREWLARVQHDLVKRLLWPARDRRELGGTAQPGELLPHLIDEEGQPTTPLDLWRALRQEAPAPTAALDLFEGALERAVLAAEAGDLDGVLQLEAAFAALKGR